MSQRPTPSSHDGKINLEQQRKRAKELLRSLKDGTAPDQLAQVPNVDSATVPTLSHAQWLIAKQLGFSSWPRLKAHIDAIEFAARNPGFEASDEARTTHWRCGNDIAHKLGLAGFKGSFQMVADPLCMGPVQNLPLDVYKAIRSSYISRTFNIDKDDVAKRTDDEYASLKRLNGTDHNVLWCEADAYDQLFLIRALASLDSLPARLELIEVKHIPGAERFIGIGQLAPDVLAWLWPQRRRVDEAALQLARQAWLAYCDTSPVQLANLARSPQPALPLLAPALLRQLQELPGIEDGLSLTERLSLQFIAEVGAVSFGRVFDELMGKRDPLPSMGDMMFHAMMRPLIDAATPLLIELNPELEWPKRTLQLTALGQKVAGGLAYWPDHALQERWVGGVCIRPGQPHWMIDEHSVPAWRD